MKADQLRQRFEKECGHTGRMFSGELGEYLDREVQVDWEGWAAGWNAALDAAAGLSKQHKCPRCKGMCAELNEEAILALKGERE